MESEAENRRLTQVGGGTPMGELLRRYWWPIAVNSELVQTPTKAVTLLGESLVLFRDRVGRYGLVSARCAHRSFDMGVFAIPEEDGLRCPYHGWVYSHTGQCLETPPEPQTSTFKDRIRIPAYPVEELGGLIFAYLGPDPAPLLPRWDLFAMDNVFRVVGQTIVPCNWLQCMENSVDQVHDEWLHGWLAAEVALRVGNEPSEQVLRFKRGRHAKIDWTVSDVGIMKRRLREGWSEDNEDWAVGHPLVFPGMVRLGGSQSYRYTFQIRVPMDDEHTWHLEYDCYDPGLGIEVPKQETVPVYETPIKDSSGNNRYDYILSQDFVAWWSQGGVTDRSAEHLGESDRGVIMFRHLLRDQMRIVAEGGEPINVFHDPDQNAYLRLAPDVALSEENLIAAWLRSGDFRKSIRSGPTGDLCPALDQVEELFARAEASRSAGLPEPVQGS
jgi:5,5'-dehydrodivanillate O-demethylase